MERQRLHRLFGALVLALGAGQACRAAVTTPGGTEGDGGPATETDGEVPGDGSIVGRDCASTLVFQDAGPEADAINPVCEIFLPCGVPKGVVASGCELYYSEPASEPLDARDMYCQVLEGHGCSDGAFDPPATGIDVSCFGCGGAVGRGTSGIAPMLAPSSSTKIGAYFAKMAHDEAASVHAFARLHDELAHHRAPAQLLAAAKRAERDEIVHARLMAAAARRHGATPRPVRIRPARRVRSLEAIAIENAVEGCVRETFGALVATWQARHASEPGLRSLFSRISRDETNHAALAWQVAAWLDRTLSSASCARVRAARRDEVTRASAAMRRQRAPSYRARAGLPDAATSSALFDAMTSVLL